MKALKQAKSCNGFCGVQECKENQENCIRISKTLEQEPLSDEEILGIADKRQARIKNNLGNDLLLISFARAIEAKVRGEK